MLQRYAVTLASLTFALLVLGGLVHNTRSSLACPDWPLCYGQVMPKMEGEVLVEHSHRMVATAIGLLTIGLAIALYRRRRNGRPGDSKLAWLGGAALATVVIQGVLGGITVLYRLPTWVSTAHLGVSMIFFALLIYLAVRLGRKEAALPPSVQRVAVAGAAVVYVQLLVGAVMRHAGAGLSCVDWPLCRGEVFPTGANAYLLLHMWHRILGVVVLGAVLAVVGAAWRASAGRSALRALLVGLPLLVVVQLALGVLSITTFLGVIPVTAHLGVAALIFAGLVVVSCVAHGVGSTLPDAQLRDSRTDLEQLDRGAMAA